MRTAKHNEVKNSRYTVEEDATEMILHVTGIPSASSFICTKSLLDLLAVSSSQAQGGQTNRETTRVGQAFSIHDQGIGNGFKIWSLPKRSQLCQIRLSTSVALTQHRHQYASSGHQTQPGDGCPELVGAMFHNNLVVEGARCYYVRDLSNTN